MNLEVEEIAFVNPHAALQPFCGSVEHCGCGYRHLTGSLVSSRRGTPGNNNRNYHVLHAGEDMHACVLHQSDPHVAISLPSHKRLYG
jgi:hypothetical protein